MSFNVEEVDPHGECAAEIHKLQDQLYEMLAMNRDREEKLLDATNRVMLTFTQALSCHKPGMAPYISRPVLTALVRAILSEQ